MIPPLLDNVREDLCEYFGVNPDMWSGKDVLIIVGHNGAGKSFVRRMLKVGAQESNIRVYDFSQERRCGGGIANAFLYGSETDESTGYLTLHTFRGAFRQDPEDDYLLLWDEPEIGLSEESQLGLVAFLREQLEQPKARRLGCIFMTHSRSFVQGFLDYPDLAFVDLNKRYRTARGWVNRKPKAIPIETTLRQGLARYRELSQKLKR